VRGRCDWAELLDDRPQPLQRIGRDRPERRPGPARFIDDARHVLPYVPTGGEFGDQLARERAVPDDQHAGGERAAADDQKQEREGENQERGGGSHFFPYP
jgi:hypothetical protein